jgi:UDP-N-acetylmuramoylalanine--D-glutamate ligase
LDPGRAVRPTRFQHPEGAMNEAQGRFESRIGEEEGDRREVSIIGLGTSGEAAARLALHRGEQVYVSDRSTNARAAARARELHTLGAVVQLGLHDLERIAASRLVVASPGIPPDAPVLTGLRSRGVSWVSEPEFAIQFYRGSLIAVTGTNGKTTTAVLAAHLLGSSGIDVALGGNVGGDLAPPASELAMLAAESDWWVLEVSSFQLSAIEQFKPDIGVLTHLAPDHQDRYPDTAAYFADKAQLFRNATPSSRWVLNGDDPSTLRMAEGVPGQVYLVMSRAPSAAPAAGDGQRGPAAFIREGVLTLRIGVDSGGPASEEALVPRKALRLIGHHNVMNALAAALAARLAGADANGIRDGLASFEPLPHRLEAVGENAGVLWVNDSKATNVAASVGALGSLDRPVVLLLGGKDKGESFRPLAAALIGKARAVVLYGEAAPRLESELSEELSTCPIGTSTPMLVTADEGFDAAVAAARSLVREGDVVLLSPACPSFDLFEGYEARGRRFSDLAAVMPT